MHQLVVTWPGKPPGQSTDLASSTSDLQVPASGRQAVRPSPQIGRDKTGLVEGLGRPDGSARGSVKPEPSRQAWAWTLSSTVY